MPAARNKSSEKSLTASLKTAASNTALVGGKAANDDFFFVRRWIQENPRTATRVISLIEDDDVRESLLKNWSLWRRDGQNIRLNDLDSKYEQILLLCGRSWGKTRWVAETLREYCTDPNHAGHRVGIIGKNREDIQKVIYEGDSGLFNCMTAGELANIHYDKSKLDIVFKSNHCRLFGIPADKPEKMRGPQFHLIVSDEICKYQYPQDVIDQIDMCLRLGDRPIAIFATTPKPTKQIRELNDDARTLVVTGASYDNKFLTKRYFARLKRKLTARLYKQEVLAKILDDNEHALFAQDDIEKNRILRRAQLPELKRIVVAVDPATTSNEESDATGIIVVGVDYHGEVYILEDNTAEAAKPKRWAEMALESYDKWGASYIVAEGNQGGEMVEYTIQSLRRSVKVVRVHAKVGKAARAEPVSALYEQGLVHHLGLMADLESELTEWDPTMGMRSPNRLDAMVWGVTELMPDRDRGDLMMAFA